MKLKRFGFLRHYRKIRIEGLNLSKIVNKCIKNGIILKDLIWEDSVQSTVTIKGEDFERFRREAGNSYRMTVLEEGGIIPVFKNLKSQLISVLGAFLLGALLFYQGFFIAEIRVDGYTKTTEAEIRETLTEAGLYEGARKPDSYEEVKAALYENHDTVTWVGIFERGRLVEVTIAEADDENETEVSDTTPVDIVAERTGIVEKIIPLQGNAMVQKGDYVNKGDLLISGTFEYQSTDYSRGDKVFRMYSHADGQVMAKIPRQVTFYIQNAERVKEKTGRSVPGLYIRLGDLEIDTARKLYRYEASRREETTIIDIAKPLPLKISTVRICQVNLRNEPVTPDKLRRVTEAAVRQYAKDNLEKHEMVLSSTISFRERENLMEAVVFMENLEDIGVDKKIKVKKNQKDEEKTQ